MYKAVSSAHILTLVLPETTFGRSLMYIMNNNGPRIDPCGIPHTQSACFDDIPLTCTKKKKKKVFHKVLEPLPVITASSGILREILKTLIDLLLEDFWNRFNLVRDTTKSTPWALEGDEKRVFIQLTLK